MDGTWALVLTIVSGDDSGSTTSCPSPSQPLMQRTSWSECRANRPRALIASSQRLLPCTKCQPVARSSMVPC